MSIEAHGPILPVAPTGVGASTFWTVNRVADALASKKPSA